MTAPSPAPLGHALDAHYASLPEAFHARVRPTPVDAPALVALNEELARELGLDPALLRSGEGVEILSGNRVPKGAHPVAMVYAGHQFGGWVPRLGDGRAILLGELEAPGGGSFDLHLKGAGRTPFSRRGDGRSSLGPVVREYLGSEAMAALGIPTTRALAALHTGESVWRQTGEEPGGILVRVARSHIRIGTFEYFARQGDEASVRRLLDHVLDRHLPELRSEPDPAAALLAEVRRRSARLVADWLSVGFVHGVMNTDNVSITGETLDFGPFGWLDPWDPGQVYSSIDRGGRYAFGRQPGIAHWNLARLAETLLPHLDPDRDAALEAARSLLDPFPEEFRVAWHRRLARKVGLPPTPEAAALAEELLELMATGAADMTATFRHLTHAGPEAVEPKALHGGALDAEALAAWCRRWRQALDAHGVDEPSRLATMKGANPAYVLRNHLAEGAVEAAVERLDFGPMERLLEVLGTPFEEQPGAEDLARPPREEERVLQTFCGT